MSVRVRIAPSPTGNMHIGTAYAAAFNLLFARHNNGQFIIRIEDTDVERSNKEYEKSILDGLEWLGIKSDEPVTRDSERLAIYRSYIEKLLESGKAFWCHHTKAELEAEQKEQMANKQPTRHVCSNKNTELAKTPGAVIRLAVEDEDNIVGFEDVIRGRIEVSQRSLGDLSIAKSLDTPLYNFAVVVDDIEMKISHVIRGEDHISNTPKQILIYQALGAELPKFAHMPLMLGTDRSKLSKRHGAVSVVEYQKDYLPEALMNFICSLGYTFSKEIMTFNEMVEEFELEKMHKSGAIFDVKKLNWINAQYARTLTLDKLREVTGIKEIPNSAVTIITERLEKLSEVSNFKYLWQRPDCEPGLLAWKEAPNDQTVRALTAVRTIVADIPVLDAPALRSELDELSKDYGGRGAVYWPFRVALSGEKASPDPTGIASVIGREETLERINLALRKLA
ncbi:MAG: glutamate--tRNA ligase [Patescibacteria group bacterium]